MTGRTPNSTIDMQKHQAEIDDMELSLRERIRKVFSDATVLTFDRMAAVSVSVARADGNSGGSYDLSAIIGFTGDLAGNCALRLSSSSAREAITRVAGEAIDSPVEIADGVGELVNMIAGNAKAALADYAISLSFPEVIRGVGHEIGFYRHPSVVDILCTSEIGTFAVIVAYSESEKIDK